MFRNVLMVFKDKKTANNVTWSHNRFELVHKSLNIHIDPDS